MRLHEGFGFKGLSGRLIRLIFEMGLLRMLVPVSESVLESLRTDVGLIWWSENEFAA